MAVATDDLDAQIATKAAELAALQRRRAESQDQAFVLQLQRVIPPGVMFRCADVLVHATLHPELAAALEVVGIRNARQLGMYFARLARRRPDALECAYRDDLGRHWQLRVTA